ncbi:MAG: HD domain-containing phosphohydrolase [Trueperaceae bacterium]
MPYDDPHRDPDSTADFGDGGGARPSAGPGVEPDAERTQALASLFRDLPLPAWVFDEETLRFLDVNDAAVSVYGHPRERFARMTILDIRPREDVQALERHLHHRTDAYDANEPWRHRTADGRILEVEIDSHATRWQGRSARLVVARDVTRQNRAAREVESLNQRLAEQALRYERLAAFGAAIETMQQLDPLVRHGLQELTELLDMDAAGFYDLQAGEASLRHGYRLDLPGRRHAILTRQTSEAGLVGRVAATGRVEWTPSYDRSPYASSAVRGRGLGSQLTLPVQTGDRVGHVLAVVSFHRTVDLSDHAIAVARAFVHRLQNALERVRTLDELRATREATFRSFGVALEVRNYETAGHTDRVVERAVRFAERLGLPEAERGAIQWGAYLHDVGKIAIPDAILLKPGPLTDEEFAVVQEHATVGDRMIQHLTFLPAATRAIVRHHHERWDGTGYPDQLAGPEIPLPARLFALVDVHDALRSQRPYKPAWPPDAVREELRRCAGTQFDPELTRTFLDLLATNATEA